MKLNDLFHHPFYRKCWRMLFMIIGCIIACKLTRGAFGIIIAGVGFWGAFTRKPAHALICFALLPFLNVINPAAFGIGGLIGASARLGMPIMTIAMILAVVQRSGKHSLPILGLLAYAVVSIISSMMGYAPMISFFKLFNFVLFIVGIYVGTKNIDQNIRDLESLRAFFFAFSVFIIIGSVLLKFLAPGAAYFTMTRSMSISAEGDAIVAAQIAATGDAGLLCGVLNHSQCLGPTAACVFGWMLVDMLLIEKKFLVGHVIVIALCPIVMYWTKSRTSLLAFVVLVGIIAIYCVPKFKVSPALKRRIRSMTILGVMALIVSAIVLEVTSHGLHRWLLKHSEGNKVTVENVTMSRRGLIEDGMRDFRKNPILGMGFQVAEYHQNMNMRGRLILSAPIEKGFIPTMILGETGVLGAFTFLLFLLMFYLTCANRGYYATLALFTGYLATNLGEATFFSPGGTGGPEWLYSLAGGFVIDMVAIVQKRMANAPVFNPMVMGPRMPMVVR